MVSLSNRGHTGEGDPPLRRLRECPDCGLFSRLPVLRPGTDARCPRCGRVLRRSRHDPLTAGLALTIAASCFYALTVSTPFVDVDVHGQIRRGMLETGAVVLEEEGLWPLSATVLATIILLPLAKLLGLLIVLFGLRTTHPPHWLRAVFRWFERLGPWAMLEVYLLGLLVAYTRLVALAQVHIDVAAYGLVALILTMVAADAALDPDAVWEALEGHGATATPPTDAPASASGGRPVGCRACHAVAVVSSDASCPRCGSQLAIRKPGSLARTWALLAAAAVLYVPANWYPVMHISSLGGSAPYTILGGVRDLVEADMWPLALLVFFASITVPVVKLVGLVIMLVATHRRSGWRLSDRTLLYRIISCIGRWSMIDVFMVSILVGLVRFGIFADITSDIGAVCFGAVVILTMLAAESFDPRLMWDAAGGNQPGAAVVAGATPGGHEATP
jgi:paraquat-inducible protein A